MAHLKAKVLETRHITYELGPHETILQALVIIGGYIKKELLPDRLESLNIHIFKGSDAKTK